MITCSSYFFRSAFFIFCSEFRPKVKSEHPGLSIGEVAKKLGELWNNTNSEDKQPYEIKASKLKEKYKKVRPWASAELWLWRSFPVADLFTVSTTGRCCVPPKAQGGLGVGRESPGQGREEGRRWRRRRRWWRRGGRGRRWRRRWWVDGEWYSGHFLVYKAFNPLVHTSLTERKYISIQGVKNRKGCVYQLFLCCTVFFFPLLFV